MVDARVGLADQRPLIVPVRGHPIASHLIVDRRARISHRIPNMIRRPRLVIVRERPRHQLPHSAAGILWPAIGLARTMRIRINQIDCVSTKPGLMFGDRRHTRHPMRPGPRIRNAHPIQRLFQIAMHSLPAARPDPFTLKRDLRQRN